MDAFTNRPSQRDPMQNLDRRRWYGLRPGDIVDIRHPGTDTKTRGRVVKLHGLDNNGCTVRVRRGRTVQEIKAVCEWCDIVRKVEDRRG